MNQDKLKEILQKHGDWLSNRERGERANLSSANLSSANLRSANLRFADLSSADLRSANLRSANLRSADLRSANLSSANLRSADLSSADLRSADLSSADLSSADLSSADLRSADLLGNRLWSLTGNSENIKSIQNDKYDICYTDKVMQIGCEQHGINNWFNFDDDRISKMDSGALEWWKLWKPTLKNIIKISPAKPTKPDE